MELTLLRHGIPMDPSEWNEGDNTRPLTAEGRVQARAVVATLRSQGHLTQVNAIWSSPYLRTQQTAQIAAEILGEAGTSPLRHVTVPELASGSDLIRSLAKYLDPSQAPARLLCVGHMPDLGNLISKLTGAPGGRYGLGRAGSARLVGDFKPGGMKLEWLLSAEDALDL